MQESREKAVRLLEEALVDAGGNWMTAGDGRWPGWGALAGFAAGACLIAAVVLKIRQRRSARSNQ